MSTRKVISAGQRVGGAAAAVGCVCILSALVAAFAQDVQDPPPFRLTGPQIMAAASAPAEPPTPLCEQDGFPCSWADADPAVLIRTLEIGRAAAGRLATGELDAVRQWLSTQPGVAAVLSGPDAVGFRLDGGRFTWVGEPRNKNVGRAAVGRAAESGASRRSRPLRAIGSLFTRASEFFVPTLGAQVVGQDQNLDGKINQRDFRSALILAPFAKDEGEAALVRTSLERSPAYAGNVAERTGGWRAFLGWEQFDIVHVITDGLVTCDAGVCELRGLYTGDSRTLEPGDLSESLVSELGGLGRGLDVRLTFEDDNNPDGSAVVTAWLLVTPDFFWSTYAGSKLARRIIYLDADWSWRLQPYFYASLPRDQWGAVIGWDGPRGDESRRSGWARGIYDALVAGHVPAEYMRLDDLLQRRVVTPREPDERAPAPAQPEQPGSAAAGLGMIGALEEARAREIVSLRTQEGTLVEDGMALPFEGTAGDGRTDRLSSLTARVEGLLPKAFGTAYYPVDPVVWLELDGKRVGEQVSLPTQPTDGDDVLARFEHIDLGVDLKLRQQYELEAVVRIERPPFEQPSESRYSAFLHAPLPCEFRAFVTGGEFAGPHVGPALVIGNAVVLRDSESSWEAKLELAAPKPGEYAVGMEAVAAKVDVAGRPDLGYIYASTRAPNSQATVRVTGAEGNARDVARSDGVIEGDATGHLGWQQGSREYHYLDIEVEFRAVTFAVSPRSPYRQCLASWNMR